MRDGSDLHSDASDSARPEAAVTLRISEVSALLGVPAPTIRSWERRHALSEAARDEHGYRRYSEEDVAVLRRMRDQRARGARGCDAAAMAQAPGPEGAREQLLACTRLLDASGIRSALDLSLRAHGLPLTIEEVLLPALREIGAEWSRGRCGIAQEHLATGAVLAWLAERGAESPAPRAERPVVLSGGPQDQHTIALEAFTVLLRGEGFDCRNLGGQTPAAALQAAVEQSSAAAVVLVCHLTRHRPDAVESLHALVGSGALVFYAGAAFDTGGAREGLPGCYLGDTLTQAVATITAAVRHRPASERPGSPH